MFPNALFCTCIPILFLSISYPYIVGILQLKRALTELLLLQIVVKENLAWYVPLRLHYRPPQLSCTIDRSVHCSIDPPCRLPFAASDHLPRCRQPRQLHYHHRLSRWTWGLHSSGREVAVFHVCLRYTSLIITCYFIIQTWVLKCPWVSYRASNE